jgi:hypothetical protein
MREPDTGFLKLLPDDQAVCGNIARIDRHFPRRLITERAVPIPQVIGKVR